jgi:hypothetical protein
VRESPGVEEGLQDRREKRRPSDVIRTILFIEALLLGQNTLIPRGFYLGGEKSVKKAASPLDQ